MAYYYPLFADLKGRRCVVVGGGPIAQRKVAALRRFGAVVDVVSPSATPRLARLARRKAIKWRARRFMPLDLAGAWLVYAATDDQAVNARVFREATRRRIFTNVVDQKLLCSFIAPAVVRRGELMIAISTGGASPTLAKRLRRELDRLVGADYARALRLLGSLRETARRRLPEYRDRQRYFDRLIAGPVFRQARAGRTAQARRAALALLARWPASRRRGAANR